jgi:cyanophycin synthetase
MMGEHGGFVKEMRTGTNLAHVVEHVLLELLHLADPEHRIYTGWTTPRRAVDGRPEPGVFVIHYQVISTAQAQLAANCAVEYVEDLLGGRRPDTARCLERLKESFAGSET